MTSPLVRDEEPLTPRYVKVFAGKKEQLVNIVSPINDLCKKGGITL
jgi:hypothetical protein